MKNKFRVAACMILGDEYVEEELKQCFQSLSSAGILDVFVAYNGKRELGALQIDFSLYDIPNLTAHVSQFEWEDNFGLARQQSFDMVPKEKFDYYLWIDSDDLLVLEEPLDDIFSTLDQYTAGIFARYDYSVEPTSGKVVVVQYRERFMSTSVEWRWMHPIHETCLGPPGVQFAARDGVYIRHQRQNGEERGARARNRRILVKALKDNPNEPRHHFYMAGETMAEAEKTEDIDVRRELCHAAIEEFKKFKEMSNRAGDDFFIAQLRIAECYRMMNENLAAYEADMEAIAIYPDWPDPYIGAAKTCLNLADFRRAMAYANVAMNIAPPKTPASVEAMNRNFNPIFIRGIANEELGHLEDALKDFKAAKKFWNPPNGSLDEKIKDLKRRLSEPAKEKDEVRKLLRGTKKEKSIAFFTTPLFETWHPKTLAANGSGGAETCIMKLAPMFAADGWRTVVFGTPGLDRGVDENGVEWWNSDEYQLQEEFTVFVSSRSPYPFQQNKPNAKASLLWMHDVNIRDVFDSMTHKPDKVIGLTQWHVDHMSKLYGIDKSEFAIVPNGIDIDNFPEWGWNHHNGEPKFIWSSSPDRGLDTLVGMWPMIKSKYPEATLDIFYGFDAIDKIVAMYRERGVDPGATYLEELKNKIMGAINSQGGKGITMHGRIPQNELAEFAMDSNYWAYPTTFCETFCITALEMQAAGVIPITSSLAALNETVAFKDFMVSGWPNNVSYQREFLKNIDLALDPTPKAEDTRIRARQIGREHAEKFTWESSYSVWNDLFSNLGVSV